MEGILPRALGSTLSENIGKDVFLIGEVTSSKHGTAVIKSADGIDVIVNLPAGLYIESKYTQIIGKVMSRSSIEARIVQNIGDNFDLEVYNKATSLAMGKFRDLFT